VLYRVTAAVERALHADAAVRVAGDFLSPAVHFVGDGADLFERERGLRDQLAILVCPRAVRHVDLDPVGAVLELLARGFARLDRAVDDLRAFGHADLRRIALEVVAGGGGDGARGGEDARARDAPFVHGHFDPDVAVARAFGLDVANGGESLLERASRGDG